ncbi:MAG TPA: hypothetical protein DD637_05360 [Verrucomicrobia bacterium]|nr:hypothetical protein [Verrucomicrobiota bacterium]HCG20460.1 hypothetical protein [Verrucomicrobiota bacterium]
MRLLVSIAVVILSAAAGLAGAAEAGATVLPYVSIGSVDSVFAEKPHAGATNRFVTEGVVSATLGGRAVLSSGGASIYTFNPPDAPDPNWRSGDRVRAVCAISPSPLLPDEWQVTILSHSVLEHGRPVPPVRLDLKDVGAGRADMRTIVTDGVITDVYRDEVNPRFVYLVLSSEHEDVTLSVPNPENKSLDEAYALLDAAVTVQGLCVLGHNTMRRYITRYIEVASLADIRPIKERANAAPQMIPPKADVPSILRRHFPHRLGIRGTIVATWHEADALLRADDGRVMRFHLMRDGKMPPPGTHVEVRGFLRTNAFFAGLYNSVVRVVGDRAPEAEPPLAVSPRDILYDSLGRIRIDPRYDGRILTLEGYVKDRTSNLPGEKRCILEQDGERIAVLLGDLPIPSVGSKIRVTGACRITFDEYGLYLTRLTGFELVPRTAADIATIAPPPAWTAKRLKCLLCILALAACAILLWNASLRHLAERRGHALMREEFERAASELKAEERTRLAVELHDSVAQNITAVSLQLDTAGRFIGKNPEAARQQLGIAVRMLQSCQHEIRACIWDLRNLAMEESNLDDAIRRTVQSCLGGAHLSVAFDVPRAKLSDPLTHSILRIVRELATNAVRHGKAKNISIEGSIKNRRLLFSVTDDGCGFAPEKAPGIAEGHFGLQGVRERLRHFNGRLSVEPAANGGTRMSVELTLPELNSNEELA